MTSQSNQLEACRTHNMMVGELEEQDHMNEEEDHENY